jgi:hypothetical protein
MAEKIARPSVLASSFPGVVGGYTLTRDWLHMDLTIHAASELKTQPAGMTLTFYDPDGLLKNPSDDRPEHDSAGAPYFPREAVEFYFYLLGNLVVTFGRGELVVARGGLQALTDLLVDVMLAERGVRERGGKKRLNPYLPETQRAALEVLPGAAATRGDISAAAEAITREFLSRARRLATTTHASWPQQLQDATARHLRRHLDGDLGASQV